MIVANAAGVINWFLISSSQYFGNSGVLQLLLDANFATATLLKDNANMVFSKTTYGQLWALWPFVKTSADITFITQAADNIILTGDLLGKGMAARFTTDASTGISSGSPTGFTVPSGNILSILGPTGGMG
jgi:hypothetical protein